MKVYAFSGKAGSGKDTAARFAEDYLKENGYITVVTHYADLLKYICKTYFGWNGEKDQNGRQLLQTVGTDIVRKHNPDFWAEFIAELLYVFNEVYCDCVLIPDLRFPNELWTLRDHDYDVTHIRLDRGEFCSSLTESQKKHASETALDNEVPDYTLVNNGSLEDLKYGVQLIMEEEINEEKQRLLRNRT